jgi:exodeoxyribonuclease-5
MEKLKSDVHFQALQLKFAYAITGHKAQGGQWKNVYLEYPYLADENEMDLSYLRWLYTAFTRATEKIYLIGFPETFFEE